MLKLFKDTENIIAVTPDDKATETTYYYLFRFYHIQKNKNFVAQLTPDNPTSNRFKRFILDLPDTLNLDYGHYHYYIYQNVVDGNTDYSGLVELENGKALVPTPELETFTISDTRQDYAIRFS